MISDRAAIPPAAQSYVKAGMRQMQFDPCFFDLHATPTCQELTKQQSQLNPLMKPLGADYTMQTFVLTTRAHNQFLSRFVTVSSKYDPIEILTEDATMITPHAITYDQPPPDPFFF